MSKILFLVNHAMTLCNFRTELVEALRSDGHEVIISSPYDERLEPFRAQGCTLLDIPLSRHGTNPFRELKLLAAYRKLLKETCPDVVFSYTIKPNIYGAIACRRRGIPLIANVTGLGGALENKGLLRGMAIVLYRYAFRHVRKVFFQNTENLKFFTDHRMIASPYAVLPGSGVNLQRFTPLQYPAPEEPIRFLFIGRITDAKGIREYIAAAKAVKARFPHTEFHVCGPCETKREALLREAADSSAIIYHGEVRDVRPLLRQTHCVVLPSYHEGMANALLESAASARPVIASDIPGCREIFDDQASGYACSPRSVESVILAMERFIGLSPAEKAAMGLAGRRKVEAQFDRRTVIEAYRAEIQTVTASAASTDTVPRTHHSFLREKTP